MTNKNKAACAAAIAGCLLGGSSIFDHEARIAELEDLHPELAQERANDAAEKMSAEKPQEPAQEPEEPEAAEEPAGEPEAAPGPAEAIEE